MARQTKQREPVYGRISEMMQLLMTATHTTPRIVSKGIGMSESGFSRRMNGETPWTIGDLDAIASFLELSISRFFENPEDVRGRMLQGPSSPWTTALPGQGSLFGDEQQSPCMPKLPPGWPFDPREHDPESAPELAKVA